MLLLAKLIGRKHCLYLRRNIANRSERPVISNEVRQLIAERNALDIELYQYAQKRLEQDLSIYELDDKKLLQKFKSQNKIYSTLFKVPYETYDTCKARLRGQLGRP